MRLVSLLENTTCRADMQTEHGLSLYLECGTHKLLFDMGQSARFAENAATLGVDLTRVELAVLSHGHYDHGGGLATFLALNQTAPVYVRKGAFLPHYHGAEKYIGLDPALAAHPRLIFTEGDLRLSETLRLCGVSEERTYPPIPSGLSEKIGGVLVPDEFSHEQCLLVEEGDARVLISGCSHTGVLELICRFRPTVFVGGFHFSALDPDGRTLREAAEVLAAADCRLFTCHCTGEAQYRALKRTLPQLDYLSCGQTLTLDTTNPKEAKK